MRDHLRRHLPRYLWGGALAWCLLWTYGSTLRVEPGRPRPLIWGGDDNFYYAWAHTLAVDGDLDFRNELGFAGEVLRQSGHPEHPMANLDPARTAHNPYPIGIGLLAFPAMTVARAWVWASQALGGSEVSGFAAIYLVAFAVSSVLCGLAGVAIGYRTLLPAYGRGTALAALATALLGLSLGYYIYFESTMAHACGFGVASLFFATVFAWESRLRAGSTPALLRMAAAMGATLGLACTVRYNNAALVLAPAALSIRALRDVARDRARRKRLLFLLLVSAAVGAVVTLLAFLPQILVWRAMYAKVVTLPFAGHSYLPWPRHVLGVLFGSRNGLFTWTPLALVATVGLLVGAARGRSMAWASLAVLAGYAWILGSWDVYWLGHSFGQRGFVDASFCFAVGFCELFQPRPQEARWRRSLLTACVVLLVAWNGWFLFAYRASVQPHGEPWAGRALVSEPAKVGRAFSRSVNPFKAFRHETYPLLTPRMSWEERIGAD